MNHHTGCDSEELGYDPHTGAYRSIHDWDSDEPLSSTVMEAILALTGDEPASGPPLWETLDPDALDSLFSPDGREEQSSACLTFYHQRYRVTVQRDGHVLVYPPEESPQDCLTQD